MGKNQINQIISKMTIIAALAALGSVLMVFAEFPYPPAPWCMFEFSDTTVLVGFALYGLPGGLAVAFIKTFISLLIKPSGIYYIGQFAALIASLAYILGLYLASHVFKWFKKGIVFRIISYAFISLLVAIVLTLLNMLFITPSYLSGTGWTTCFDSQVMASAMNMLGSFSSIYWVAIIVIYLPFNLIKGVMVTGAYEVIFNRVIFVLFPKNKFISKYFLGPIVTRKEKNTNKNGRQTKEDDSDSLLSRVDQAEKKH